VQQESGLSNAHVLDLKEFEEFAQSLKDKVMANSPRHKKDEELEPMYVSRLHELGKHTGSSY
jgi:hypothetical protein